MGIRTACEGAPAGAFALTRCRRGKLRGGSREPLLPPLVAPLTALAAAATRVQHSSYMLVLLPVPRQVARRRLGVAHCAAEHRATQPLREQQVQAQDGALWPLARQMPPDIRWPSCLLACRVLHFGFSCPWLLCSCGPLCSARAALSLLLTRGHARPPCADRCTSIAHELQEAASARGVAPRDRAGC